MITGFGGVSVWSEDLNRLLPFYRDLLGLKPGEQTPGFTLFGNQTEPALGIGTHSEVKGTNNDPARHIVTDDIKADVQRLKAAGVEFIEEPTDYDGMQIATCKDPEGNYVQLFQQG